MPNHCENDLIIAGHKEKVKELLETIKGQENYIDFNTLIPYPASYTKADKIASDWQKKNSEKENIDWSAKPVDGFNQGGYEWCNDNWGTKWNAYSQSFKEDFSNENFLMVTISFSTAWSPPLPIIEKLAKQFPGVEEIKLYYYEQGAEYHGRIFFEGGREVERGEGKYFGTRGG